MSNLKNKCESFGVLLLIIDGILSMYINNIDKHFSEKVCDTVPENTNLSCTEYVISDGTQCKEEILRNWFPDLYATTAYTKFPAPIQDHKTHGSTQMWGVPKDGSINYLRGFQVIQIGMSMDTLNTKKCSVFNISAIKEEDHRRLMETLFVIKINGTFAVDIKTLPLRPVDLPSIEPDVVVQPDTSQSAYHPDLSVNVHYTQLNDTTLNISVHITPEIKNLTSMYIELSCSDGSLLQNTLDTFEISQKSFILNGLRAGNYTLKLTPSDPFLLTAAYQDECICFYEDSGDRTCTPCEGYILDIHVKEKEHHSPTRDDGNNSILTFVLAPVLAIGLAVAIMVVVCRVFIRNNKFPSCIHNNRFFNRAGTSFTDESEEKQPILQIIYTNDHIHHKNVVSSLATFLKNSTDFDVIFDCSPIREMKNISEQSLYTPEAVSYQGKQCDNADVILLVHSEWACKLKSVIESGEVNIVDVTDAEDKSFLLCINEVFQRPSVTSKLVSVRLEYTPESAVIKEPFLGPQFVLPSNIDALVKHLSTKTKQGQISDTPSTSSDDKMSIFTAINATFAYHNKHKTWLFTKLFNLKNCSSDDSGVVLPRPRYLRSRSIRSRSAETIPQHACTCGANTRQQACLQHFQKPSIRHRTYSCDLSFYAPESIADEVSERYSLLESKFLKINCRYQKILNNEMEDSDEYTTSDALSV